jgi:hypothetical protein
MAGTTATPMDFWRLAEEAERRGIRILVEPISGEHYATSATDPTRLYRLTHYSCTCKGFLTWQRCTHHSLLLAHLGWLPDVDPDPAPAAATAPSPKQDPCPDCQGEGTEPAMGRSGAWYRVPCPRCGGSGAADPAGERAEDVGRSGRGGECTRPEPAPRPLRPVPTTPRRHAA